MANTVTQIYTTKCSKINLKNISFSNLISEIGNNIHQPANNHTTGMSEVLTEITGDIYFPQIIDDQVTLKLCSV